jgi:hypothetical protein
MTTKRKVKVPPPRSSEPLPAAPEGWKQEALRRLKELRDPELQQRRIDEIKEALAHQRGPKRKISEDDLRKQIRLDGGLKANRDNVAYALDVRESTLWRWCRKSGFLDWKETCWYYSKY